jgi:hypothetical protein
MHQFVAAHDGVSRAGFDAQGAADAPVFIYKSDGAWILNAMSRVQRHAGLTCDSSQFIDALLTTGRALVDTRHPFCNGLRVSGAVRVATSRALRLRQCREDGER